MHRDDNSQFLLFIEPLKDEKTVEPVEDEYTTLMEMSLTKAKKGTSNYSRIGEDVSFREGSGFRGLHMTDCGTRSSNVDFQLENGMVTNSLAAFYLRWYRNSIESNDWDKLNQLKAFYAQV